jgi:RNA polymerase sigma-70 factor (ECF subfamily)
MRPMTQAASQPQATTHELRALLVPFISKRVDPQDVDDVVQNVFVRIQRGLGELREGDRLLAWAYQIARNVIVDYARHASLRKHENLDGVRALAAPGDEDENAAAGELARILGHFVAMLPEPYREALQMSELEGITQSEAARRAGISVSGMKSRVQRGRVQLRELLDECCDIEQDTRGAIIDVEPRNAPASIPNCCREPVRPSAPTFVSISMTNQTQANEQTTDTEQKSEGSCCGGPAPADSGACCVKDAAAKAAGEGGCGCGTKTTRAKSSCC